MGKYTLVDHESIDSHIESEIALCRERIIGAFGDGLTSLVLVGGYGRGEGGVSRDNGRLMPKNNYDFLIVLKDSLRPKSERVKTALRTLKDGLDRELSVIFEASCHRESKVRSAPHIMIFHDIYQASMTIYGHEIRTLLPETVTAPLPPVEAMRILRNRSMLLVASVLGEEHLGYRPGPGQVKTWLAKAIIGFGDAISILRGCYRARYSDKMDAIRELSFPGVFASEAAYLGFKRAHEAASSYRLQGEESPALEDFPARLQELEEVNLWVVREYTGNKALGWANLHTLRLPPTSPARILRILRNIWINVKEYGIRQNPAHLAEDPVDRLHRVVPLTLYRPDFDALPRCRAELNMAGDAALSDIQKKCCEIYAKYLV